MATLLAVFVSVGVIISHVGQSQASTHWIVTEDGKVQSQVDSVFNMKRPYDLVAFLKQEERAGMLDQLKKELLSRKDEIDKTEDRDTGLEEKFYKSDSDCLAAGKHLPELDLYISTVLPLENKGIRPEDFIVGVAPTSIYMPPDCTAFTDLPYSVHAFEHLEGMKDRQKLSGTPELGLKNAITYQDNVDEYGHRIYEAFKRNSTSWVLYNMAAFYWRIKGDPYHVIECVRRALHYSPRMQKDVALISLANVLHRARYSNEAAIVVHAALDVSKELNVNHFTLGNIYAVLGEYNKSVICFENTLKIQPDFDAAAKRKHAVLCHAKLENALEAQHRSLQRTLNDLKDYQRKHDYWQQQNDKLIAEQVPMDVKVSQHVAYEEIKLKEISAEIGDYCKMGDKDGKQVLMCSWRRKADPALGMDFSVPESKSEKEDIEPPSGPDSKPIDYSKPVRAPLFTKETVKVPKYGGTAEYLDEEWPSKEECDAHAQKGPDAHNLSSTYLSPENKGFEVKALLGEAQGLEEGAEHPLPWYPPVCTTLLDIPENNAKSRDDIKSVSLEDRTKIPLKLYDLFHRQTLLDHVNGGKITEEEVGQRILTALKKNVGPKWVLFNLAGLYWRIIGNNYHGIECFRRALYTVPDDYADIPLVNLANILYRWGRYNDAAELLRQSVRLPGAELEPATQFIYGNVMWAKKNFTGAMWRYQLALEADPNNKEYLNTYRALKCYMKFHQSAQSAAPIESEAQENGEERCVIETRTRGKNGECDGQCTQTCTVTPMNMETCSGAEMNGGGVEGPAGRKHEKCASCKCGCPRCGASPVDKCGQKGPNQAFPGASPEEVMFGGDFSGKLDEVSEYYQRNGMCQGEDCNQLRVQQGGQMPHIKLDFVDGVLHKKFIFAQSPNELTVELHECVIFNDGSKSSGCNRPEYKAYACSQKVHLKDGVLTIQPCNKGPDVKVPVGPAVTPTVDKVPPYQGPMEDIANPPQQEVSDGHARQREIYQLPDSALPNTKKHIRRRVHLAPPRIEECRKMKKVNLKAFFSTWLSVTAKNIDISRHIDFMSSVPDNNAVPVCDSSVAIETIVDDLPGIKHKTSLDFKAEGSLKEVLQTLGGRKQGVRKMAARISVALMNQTSWVAANMAALFWRVEGNAARAIDCLLLALQLAPDNAKDVSLLSLANILHRAGYINDAIVATSLALEFSRNIAVSHFTMANLYAVKAQWNMAAMFYESTLGLQADFDPAKQRLKTIQCMKVIQKPEVKVVD